MEISGYSSYIDSILGLPATASKSEVASESESHLVVRVETQEPSVRAVENFLSGNVPEQGSNVVELIHKMIF
jgi:hypothetical protein